MIVKIFVSGMNLYLTEINQENKTLLYKSDINKAIKFNSESEVQSLSIFGKYEIVNINEVINIIM